MNRPVANPSQNSVPSIYQSSGHEREPNIPVIENVDGADFRKHFARSEATVVISQDPETSNFESETVLQLLTQENAQCVRLLRVNEETGAATDVPQQFEHQSSIEVPKATETAYSTLNRPSTSPGAALPDIQDGFVKYLFDKAFSEIKRGDLAAAQPYIERLKELPENKAALVYLNSQISSYKVAKGRTMLEQGDIYSALDIFQEIEARWEATALLEAIKSFLVKRMAEQYHQSRHYELLEMLQKIRAHTFAWEEEDESTMSSLESTVLGTLVQISLGDTKPGDLQDTEDFRNHLYIFGHHEKANEVAMGLASYYLGLAIKNLDIGSFTQSSCEAFRNLDLADDNLELVTDPTTRPSVLRTVRPRSLRRELPAVERNYPIDRINISEILSIRLHVLSEIKMGHQRAIRDMIRDESWEAAWSTYVSLGSLEAGLEKSTARPEFWLWDGTQVSPWIVVGCYIATQIRKWDSAMHIGDITLTEVESLDPEHQFLYYITKAEVLFFHKRAMQSALENCQNAILLDGCELYDSRKEDAYFLLFRILTRLGLPLDADYHYSLLPNDYDEWRIYGQPGAELVSAGVSISKGRLRIDAKTLIDILNSAINLPIRMPPYEYECISEDNPSPTRLKRRLQGLLADDVSWAELDLEIYGPLPYPTFGNALHYFTFCRRHDLLDLVLENPWIDVNRKYKAERTALHEVAGFPRVAAFNREAVVLGSSPILTAVTLLNRGASLQITTSMGLTPLDLLLNAYFRSEFPHDEFLGILKLFLKSEPAITTITTTDRGQTTLHLYNRSVKNHLVSTRRDSQSQAQIKRLKIYNTIYTIILDHIRSHSQESILTVRDESGIVAYEPDLVQRLKEAIASRKSELQEDECKVVETPLPKEKQRIYKNKWRFF
ncbi:hypothetical protein ABW19_dt0210561 [Dactylella cylindrospora]|nr:hypothetical protein ABW19_dt0210561 [Dactylella cylindrospora]